jgi:hypothetical protein
MLSSIIGRKKVEKGIMHSYLIPKAIVIANFLTIGFIFINLLMNQFINSVGIK